MMDDSLPTHERRELVKTYKNVLSLKWTVVVKYAGRPTLPLMKKDGVEKWPQT